MAVVISSQFYQASLWKNISKIVFTSPNMDSPAIAGTRSHILPGEGDLGTWYEDTANMYRIEDNQWETNSDFFNYRMKCKDTIEILDHSGYIDVKETNYSSLDTFIKENSGVEVIGYADNTSYITYTKPRLEYTLTQLNLDEIYNDTTTRVREVVERREAVEANPGSTTQTRAYYTLTFNRTVGALTKVVSGVDFKVVFAFSEQSLVHDISISSIQTTQELKEIPIETLFNNPIPAGTTTHPPDRSIFFGEYSIQGSNDASIWVTLHEGANTTNLVCNVSLPEIVYYKYIRLLVTSNIGLDGTIFNTDFYGLSKIAFNVSVPQPTIHHPVLTVSSDIDVPASAGSNSISITNSGDGDMVWSAEVTLGSSWLNITSGGAGTNSGVVSFNFISNALSSVRTATITITATGAVGSPVDVYITQAAASVVDQPILSLSTQSVPTGSGASSGNLSTVSNTGTGTMAWTAVVTTGGTWCSITSGSSGSNTGIIVGSILANTGAQRTATITITATGATGSPKTITIVQAAVVVVVGSLTDWSVTPSSNLTIDGSSTDADFLITNNIASIMDHTSSVVSGAWITVPSPGIWVNDGYVMFDCSTNTTGLTRVGTVRISVSWQNGNVSHKDLTITQNGLLGFISTPTTNIDTNTIEQLDSETDSSTLYGYSIVVTQLVTEVEGAGSCNIIYLPYNVVLSNWTAVVTTGATWFSISPNSGGAAGGTIVGTYLLNKGPERSAVITVTMPGAANSPEVFTIKQKVGIPGSLFFSTLSLTYNGAFVNTSTIASFATDRIKEIVDTKTLTGTVYNIPRTLLYYVYTLDRNKGWYTPVNVDVPPYIIFTFPDATKITAMYMSSVQVNQELWQIPLATLFNITTPAATTTLTPKTYFIGNFNIQGSNDQITWTTIYTGANTTKPTKTAYFANTQYYKYYKLNILNNTGLSTTAGTPPVVNTVFDTDYYGIRGLKFYVNDFSLESGSSFIALYEFSDFSNPKIMKVSNAAMIPSTIPEENTTTTNHLVKGLLTETRVSGGVTLVSGVYQTVFYSSYAVNIKSSTDPYDYLTTATCISPTDGGTGTSTNSQTYTKQDKINTVVSSIVERGNKGKIDEYLLFRSTGTTTVPINTADWTGLVDITYATSTSGTVISGVLATNIAGITERKYESSLYSRRDSFRLTISDYVTSSGIISEDTDLYMWGFTNRLLDLDCQNSIVFEITNGEAYNCRLTAWDDVTHSTTKNELIQGDHVRCSAMVYCCTGSKLIPAESKSPLNLVYPPVHNRIFKGNTIDGTNKLFYGDFDMVYRYQSTVYGDYLIFKPLLYGIDENISYGVHDYLITFHYSYT